MMGRMKRTRHGSHPVRRTLCVWAVACVLLLPACSNPGAAFFNNRREQFYERGIDQYERGDYEQAAASFNKFLSYQPHIDGYHLRGRSYAEIGEHEKAFEDYRKALDMDPGNAYVRRARAWLHFIRSEFKEATEDYEQAYTDDPRVVESLSFGAWSALGDGNFEKAAELVDIAQRELKWQDKTENDGNDVAYNAIVAYVSLRALDQPNAANRELKKSLLFADQTVWPYDALRYYNGDIDGEELLKRTTTNGAATEAHTYLAMDALLNGDKEKAQPHLDWVAQNGDKIFYEYYISMAIRDGKLTFPVHPRPAPSPEQP